MAARPAHPSTVSWRSLVGSPGEVLRYQCTGQQAHHGLPQLGGALDHDIRTEAGDLRGERLDIGEVDGDQRPRAVDRLDRARLPAQTVTGAHSYLKGRRLRVAIHGYRTDHHGRLMAWGDLV